MTDDVLLAVEIYKLKKPTIYKNEIREKILKEGICNAVSLLGQNTVNTVNTALRKKLDFTWKKISQIPRERNDARLM